MSKSKLVWAALFAVMLAFAIVNFGIVDGLFIVWAVIGIAGSAFWLWLSKRLELSPWTSFILFVGFCLFAWAAVWRDWGAIWHFVFVSGAHSILAALLGAFADTATRRRALS